MKVIISVDYSAFTEQVMQAAKMVLAGRIPQPEITVLHVIDQTLFIAGTGAEQAIMEGMRENGREINKMACEYFGDTCTYIEEYGVPMVKIDEILANTPFDMLVIGTKGRSMLANVLLGSVAEHLLHRIKKPVLIVPR